MSNHSKYQSSGSAMSGLLLAFIGLLLVITPFIASGFLKGTNFELGAMSIIAITILGGILTIIGVILILLTKLYIKAPANEALVITGWNKKIIVDGGGFFIAMFQELMAVPLETMKLVVKKTAEDAFLTNDKLRADISAEFFIKIPKDPEKIQIAATSLGKGTGITTESILKLVEDKLTSALRDAVAKKTLEELHSDRAGFAGEVETAVKNGLVQNGLELEYVTISNLDQANYANLNLNNVFNAQGAKTVAAFTEVAIKDKKKIELDNRLLVQTMEVETTKKINQQKVEEANSNSQKEKDIALAQALATKETREKVALFEQEAETAEIAKNQAVEVAEIQKSKTTELAEIEKAKELAVKSEGKQKEVEVAAIDRLVIVAQKKEEEAAATAKANDAKAKAQTAEESIQTVKVQAIADRAKITTVVAEQAKAEQEKISANNQADIKAYETQTLASADRKASEDKAAAVTVEADSQKKAAIARAEGKKAEEMIPVEVQKELVKVEAERVMVLEKELKAKSEHAAVSVKLETDLSQINADKEIGIANANALGQALSSADIKIIGDASTLNSVYGQFHEGKKKAMFLNTFSNDLNLNEVDGVAQNMVKQYLLGQETAMLTEGFFNNAPDALLNLLKTTGGSIAGIVALATKLLGRDPQDTEVEKLQKAVEAAKKS
jgi:flotillin